MDRTEHPTFFLKSFDGERLTEVPIARAAGELFELEDQMAAMVDVRQEPMILEFPSFDSKYVSLMVVAYDHYVNTPMSTTIDIGIDKEVDGF